MGACRLGRFGALFAWVEPEAWKYPRVPRGVTLPRKALLRIPTAVQDQGDLGSCTAHAFGTCLEILVGTGLEVSKLALYRDFREFSHPSWVDRDTGALMEPSARALVSRGAGSELLWPYRVQDFRLQPTSEYRTQALDHRVLSFYRAQGVDQAKSALAAGFPIAGSFDVPSAFSETGVDGLWRDRGGGPEGGHAVCIYGYDDDMVGGVGAAPGCFFARNSWGADWGLDGRFMVPYSVYAPGGRWWDSVVITLLDTEAGK